MTRLDLSTYLYCGSRFQIFCLSLRQNLSLTAPNQAFVEALSFRHSRFFHPIDKIFGHFNKHSSISLGWLDMGVFMKFVKRGDGHKPRNSIQTLDKIHASFKGLPLSLETCRKGLALSLDFGGDGRRNLVKH